MSAAEIKNEFVTVHMSDAYRCFKDFLMSRGQEVRFKTSLNIRKCMNFSSWGGRCDIMREIFGSPLEPACPFEESANELKVS